MNLSSIDLNLLVVFDALMTQRQVTRAGQQIGLSQPATSNALARLRKLLNDDLFVRCATGLQPTPKALALAQQLQPALGKIQSALAAQKSFEPTTSNLTFRVGMSDYVEFTLLPLLLQRLQQLAPSVSLQVRSGDRAQQLSMLNNGELDLLCGLFPEKIKDHKQQQLFQEKFVVACRLAHPTIKGSLSLQEYVSAHHLLVSVKEDRTGRIDALLAKQNLQRHIALSVPHFLVVPQLIAQTDLITTMANKVATAFAPLYKLQILPLPLHSQGFKVSMRWHHSNDNAPAQQWLRACTTEVARAL